MKLKKPSDIYELSKTDKVNISDSHPGYNGEWTCLNSNCELPSGKFVTEFIRKHNGGIDSIAIGSDQVEISEGRIRLREYPDLNGLDKNFYNHNDFEKILEVGLPNGK